MTVHPAPRAVLYLRESQDREGTEDGINRHRNDCQRIARERGWHITAEYVDNNLTASNRHKDRPGYDRMCAGYAAGEFDVILCWDLDRLTRQPRQLEDWIDAAEERGLVVVTANGEADLSTDGGRLFARMKAAVARSEIERKGARQRLAAAQRAEQGRPPKGTRLMGYSTDGNVIEDEARTVRHMFGMFHQGASLREIVRWLQDTGVPARRGGDWSPSSVRTILTNPRYCGRAVYNGSTNGHTGAWEPVVDEATWDVVNIRLTDPRRRKQTGTDRKYLGSGLFLCAVCDRPVTSNTGGGAIRYRCPEAHVLRMISSVDKFVLAVVRGYLARPDVGGLLEPPDTGASRETTAEITRLRASLVKTEADYDADLIDGKRFRVKTAKLTAQLDAALARQARSAAGSGVGTTLTAPDPVAAFDAAPLGIQRAVIAFLVTVRLHHHPRGRHFDADTVDIS